MSHGIDRYEFESLVYAARAGAVAPAEAATGTPREKALPLTCMAMLPMKSLLESIPIRWQVQEPPLTLRDPRTVPISVPHTNTQHSLEKPVMKKEKIQTFREKAYLPG